MTDREKYLLHMLRCIQRELTSGHALTLTNEALEAFPDA